MGQSDRELLAEFVRSGSEEAFAQIVLRHGELVRAAAVRHVRRADLADDVTQAVFIVLARRARVVPGEYLPAWLLRTTRFCARDALKMQARREHHEKQAATMRPTTTAVGDWTAQQIAECLDPALARLRTKEQNAIALRFLQSKSTAEVAEAMGITKDAAQKIIARSLVKMRRMLSSRGVTLSSAAALAQVLGRFGGGGTSTAVASAISSAATGGGAGVASQSIAQGAGKLMLWAKSKWIAAVVGVFILAGGAAWKWSGQEIVVAATEPAKQPFVQPFESPFIELVGCRMKQRLKLDLALNVPQKPVAITEHQYFQIEWTGRLDGAASADSVDLSVRSAKADASGAPKELWRVSGIPSDIQSVVYGKPPAELLTGGSSTAAAPLKPGDYLVELADHTTSDEGKPPSKLATLPFKVEPYQSILIFIYDLQPDGSVFNVGIFQFPNTYGQLLRTYDFTSPQLEPIDSFFDEDGRPMEVITAQKGQLTDYHCKFNRPIKPGAWMMTATVMTTHGQIQQNPDQTLTYEQIEGPCPGWSTRLVDLIRLPRGASVVSTNPASLPQRTVDGQVQIYLDKFVARGGSLPVAVQYRLDAATSQ